MMEDSSAPGNMVFLKNAVVTRLSPAQQKHITSHRVSLIAFFHSPSPVTMMLFTYLM